MTNIYDLTFEKLEEKLVDKGCQKFRVKQVFNWLYINMVENFDEMKNIDAKTRTILEENFFIPQLKCVVKSNLDKTTQKLLIELDDKQVVETVAMQHSYGMSVCVTTQVGCKIGCSFCASHLGGFIRNLSAGEIVTQVMLVNRLLKQEGNRVSHIVIMGIGEPLDNLKSIFGFIDIINDERGFKIGARHITLSTSGIVPKFDAVAMYPKQINLAVSLHAPDNKTRSQIMKINDVFPVEAVMEAIDEYILITNRRVSIEYIMLEGVNDSNEHARRLVDILHGRNVHVNLIPYNSVDEYSYKASSEKAINDFYKVLSDAKIQVTTRYSKGTSIDGACGQLRRTYNNDSN